MVASETVPFAKSGGLADVVGALSKKLSLLSHDVRIVMPRYGSINPDQFQLLPGSISVPVGFENEEVRIYQGFLPESEVPVYFIEHPLFSKRMGYYGDHGSHTYRDNHLRFSLFSRSVFPLLRSMEWIPDILHCHDWQSGLVSGYLGEYESRGAFKKTACVFTIHNIGYQGLFSKHDIHTTRLSWETINPNEYSYGGSVNFMKCAILNSDGVTTVSPTYAKEIRSPEFGHGLEKLLEERSAVLHGILNGADYSEWDPSRDPHIPAPYTAEDMSGKAEARRLLQEKTGLPVRSDLPIIGIVSRLAAQKGFYELCDPHRGALRRICSEMAVQVVVLGTGEKWIEDELHKMSAYLPNLKVITTFSDTLAHLIEAGSDLFLMPSRYEPCGLNQIYSLRYGTLPIVRATGGLADTVKNYNSETGDGTGFMFDILSPESIFHTTAWAVATWYERPDHFRAMQKRAMKEHFSWTDSAKQYADFYQQVAKS
jgi:starch synthase